MVQEVFKHGNNLKSKQIEYVLIYTNNLDFIDDAVIATLSRHKNNNPGFWAVMDTDEDFAPAVDKKDKVEDESICPNIKFTIHLGAKTRVTD